MYVDQKHIGAVIRWTGWDISIADFLLLEIDGQTLRGRYVSNGVLGGRADWRQGAHWEFSGPDKVAISPVLPKDIEVLMGEFGCHEPQTRKLVEAILAKCKLGGGR